MRTKQSPKSPRLGNMAGGRRLRAPKLWIAGGLAVVMLYAGWALLAGQGRAQLTELSAAERAALVTKGRDKLISVEKRSVAPPIKLQTASYADGTVFDLSEERGKVVVLYFMAAWCLTCVPEALALADLHKAYANKGVRILVLDVERRETEAQLAEFRERAGNGAHLWALDRDHQVARPYRIRALDTTIFIDRGGKIAYRDAIPTRYEDLAAVTEALLR